MAMETLEDRPRWVSWVLLSVSLAVVLVSVRPYAGGYNDGSRLATVESLVDHQSFAFERSIFVEVPAITVPPEQFPYPLTDRDRVRGEGTRWNTGDKIYVRGHYYSDKPPTQAVYLAGVYQVLQWTTGLQARENVPLFCYLMALASSGLCYVLMVLSAEKLFWRVGLPLRLRLVLVASLGLGTLAWPHAMYVGSHICQLGVAMLALERLMAVTQQPRTASERGNLLLVGLLAGLGYGLEQAAGGLFLACVGLFVLWQRGVAAAFRYGLGALPFLLLHHGIVYAIAGTLRPINAIPEHFQYPGAVFGPENMTGRWHHASPAAFVEYGVQLVVGNQGFLHFNPALFLLIPASVWVWRQRTERPWLVLALGWAGATWLAYACLSKDYSGGGLSIRWFVPLLSVGYLILAFYLRDHPDRLVDLVVLSLGGVALNLVQWWCHPDEVIASVWATLWYAQGTTLALWLALTRTVPESVDRRLERLWPWGFAAGVVALLGAGGIVYALEPRPVFPRWNYSLQAATTGLGAVLLGLGVLIGTAARVGSRGDRRLAGIFAGGALLLGPAVLAVGGLLLAQGERIELLREGYLGAFDRAGWLSLPAGVVRLLERLTGNWLLGGFLAVYLGAIVLLLGVVGARRQRRKTTESLPTATPTSRPTT